MLPDFFCSRLRLSRKQAKMINAKRSKNPSMDPMTMPAMAPPLSPWPPVLDPTVAPAVEEEVGLERVEEKTSTMEENTGKVTP